MYVAYLSIGFFSLRHFLFHRLIRSSSVQRHNYVGTSLESELILPHISLLRSNHSCHSRLVYHFGLFPRTTSTCIACMQNELRINVFVVVVIVVVFRFILLSNSWRSCCSFKQLKSYRFHRVT